MKPRQQSTPKPLQNEAICVAFSDVVGISEHGLHVFGLVYVNDVLIEEFEARWAAVLLPLFVEVLCRF